jgi:hypothetical protein
LSLCSDVNRVTLPIEAMQRLPPTSLELLSFRLIVIDLV